jgi:hypothetical protein
MSMRVPFLEKSRIVAAADQVLAAYAAGTGRQAQPPIPVEDIIERGLGLRLDFVTFAAYPAGADVLGATYVAKKLICINQALLGDRLEGRFCFTCAHEIGHWALHRQLVAPKASHPDDAPRILCRSSQAKTPIEWQADAFASCLLMPEAMVRRAFQRAFGCETLELVNAQSAYAGPLCFDPCAANWPFIADALRQTGGFHNVSKQAMIIRLQGLGLVRNATSRKMAWSNT